MKFTTKPIRHYPPHLGHVATLSWEIKNSHFYRYSADVEENEQDFDEMFVFEGVHSKDVEKVLEKSWTKRVNKQLKKLRDTGTVDRWPGQTPRSACTEENVETVND